MKESEYVDIFEKEVEKFLTEKNFSLGRDLNLAVQKDCNLFYELSVNQDLELLIKNIKKPARGESAFQTDLCVFEKKGEGIFPRVVIEFKIDPSTHDILVYSAKAEKHKRIYPWLRYGMLVCELNDLPIKKFLKHNDYLDFCVGAKNFFEGNGTNKLHELAQELILSEIRMSQVVEDIFFEKPKGNYYQKQIYFGEFKNLIK